MMKKVRRFLIKQGAIKPATIQESKEIFPFPDATKENRNTKPIGLLRSMELCAPGPILRRRTA